MSAGTAFFIGGGFTVCVGILLVAAGIVLPIVIENLIQTGLYKDLVIDSTNSTGYARWVNGRDAHHPVHTYASVYVFNLTNPDEVLQGAKPHVQEIGPFVYEQMKFRFNVSWEQDGKVIKYKEQQYYVFREEMSIGNDTDYTVNSYNLVFQDVVAQLKTPKYSAYGPFLQAMLYKQYTPRQRLFIHRTVREVLWGYVDPVLAQFGGFLNAGPRFPGAMANETLSQAVAKEKFNLIYSGKTDSGKRISPLLRQFIRWENQSSVSCWSSPRADAIYGTDGTQYKAGITDRDSPGVFVDLMKRSVHLTAAPTQNLSTQGIPLVHFQIPVSAMQNASANPNNAGFNAFGPPGMLNMTSCASGIPIFYTKSHFYQTGKEVQEGVTGMTPPSASDETVMGVESVSGVAMHVQEKLQVNVHLAPVYSPGNSVVPPAHWFTNLTEVYAPILWMNRHGEVPASLANTFKSQVLDHLRLGRALLFGGTIGGGALVLLAVALFVVGRQRAAVEAEESRVSSWAPHEPLLYKA